MIVKAIYTTQHAANLLIYLRLFQVPYVDWVALDEGLIEINVNLFNAVPV